MTLLLLCLQAVIEPGASAPAPCKAVRFLTASTTGAFVAVGEEGGVHFLDGTTFRAILRVNGGATAVVFGEKDETATILGETWIRYETASWTEKDRGQLPDARFRKGQEGQALGTSDGSAYYCSKDAGLSKAPLDIGAVKAEVLTRNRWAGFERVERVLAVVNQAVVVDGDGMACVVIRGGQYGLAGSARPLAAAGFGPRAVVVTKVKDVLYDAANWKATWSRTAENTAAAFDLRRGRVYCAGKDTVRYWRIDKPEEVGSFAGTFQALAIDGAGRSLYGLDGEKIRSWTLKD
jgi:hypothetical protein